jgi:YidC/Oxa1 family membrane protein insertase
MVASQRLTPTPGMDPAQQKMMTFTMPIMYAFFFWNYASGLALYAFTGALIGVLQQMVLNRTELGKEMRAIAAKRAARKQTKAGGKVIQARR